MGGGEIGGGGWGWLPEVLMHELDGTLWMFAYRFRSHHGWKSVAQLGEGVSRGGVNGDSVVFQLGTKVNGMS